MSDEASEGKAPELKEFTTAEVGRVPKKGAGKQATSYDSPSPSVAG